MAKKKKEKETSLKVNCFHYGLDNHGRRDCKAYLEPMKKRACDAPFSSSVFVIEISTIYNNNQWYWILVVVLTYALMCKD